MNWTNYDDTRPALRLAFTGEALAAAKYVINNKNPVFLSD